MLLLQKDKKKQQLPRWLSISQATLMTALARPWESSTNISVIMYANFFTHTHLTWRPKTGTFSGPSLSDLQNKSIALTSLIRFIKSLSSLMPSCWPRFISYLIQRISDQKKGFKQSCQLPKELKPKSLPPLRSSPRNCRKWLKNKISNRRLNRNRI